MITVTADPTQLLEAKPESEARDVEAKAQYFEQEALRFYAEADRLAGRRPEDAMSRRMLADYHNAAARSLRREAKAWWCATAEQS